MRLWDLLEWGSTVVSVAKDGKKNKVIINNSNGEINSISSPARVVLCKGFDVSTLKLWKSMSHFSDGTQQINEVDESTKMPFVFLAGPMLYHELTPCQDDGKQQTKNGTTSKVEGNGTAHEDGQQDLETPSCDTGDGVIFCFI